MTNCSWMIEKKNTNKYNSDEFLKVKPDCSLQIRLIGQPVKGVKIFTDSRKCIILDNAETGQRLKEKYSDILSSVSVRFASWCIDSDDNSLKILDMPMSVARAFGIRAELIGCKISGSQEGCDWKIITNGKQGKDVRYEAVYIEETPLSEAEQEMVKNRKAEEGNYFDLTKIFKSCSFEDAEDRLLE